MGAMSDEVRDGAELGWELSTAVVLFHQAIADRLGLSAADHKALNIITRAVSLTAGELAQQTGLSPGAATGLIDRLEAAGCVERSRDPADRRRVVVRPIAGAGPDSSDLGRIFQDLSVAMWGVLAQFDLEQQLAIHDYVVGTIAVLKEQTRRLSGTADDQAAG
jgi:hypothetical protein